MTTTAILLLVLSSMADRSALYTSGLQQGAEDEFLTKAMSMFSELCPYTKLCSQNASMPFPDSLRDTGMMPCCQECFCDEDCDILGDCCFDKPVTRDVRVRCRRTNIGNSELTREAYYMIDSCNMTNLSLEVKRRCEEPNVRIPLENIPVSAVDTGYIYASIYCAHCNGIHDVITWHAVVDFENFELLAKTNGNSTFDTKESMYLSALEDDYAQVSSLPPDNVITGRFTCSFSKDFSCSDVDPFLIEACQKVYSPYGLYKSVFCYKCRWKELTVSKTCRAMLGSRIMLNGFSGLINFMEENTWKTSDLIFDAETESDCGTDKIFDPYKRRCRNWFCPIGYQKEGEVCRAILNLSFGMKLSLTIKIAPMDDVSELLLTTADHVNEVTKLYLPLIREQYPAVQLHEQAVFLKPSTDSHLPPFIVVVFGMVTAENVQSYSILETISKRITTTEEFKFQKNGLAHSFKAEFTDRVSYGFSQGDPSCVDLEDGESLEGVRFKSDQGVVYTKYSRLLQCRLIQIDSTEFERFEFKIRLLGNSHYVYEPSFLLHTDATGASVCLEDYLASIRVTEPESVNELVKGITSACLTLLSICALGFTVLTYLLFRHLRTLPGKNNMMFCFHLMVAQTLYLFGMDQTFDATLCATIGVCTHYFWLASFAWMNICSYHMYRAFVRNTFQLIHDIEKHFRRYVTFSILFPTGVVALTIGVSLFTSQGTDIGYGGKTVCYISSLSMIGYTFVIPLGFVLVTNIGFFVAVFIKLRKESAMIGQIEEGDKNYVIYLKLSTLTGVAWTFGLLYTWTNIQSLDWLFVVFNSGHGILLSFAFVCNKNVWNSYRKCICPQRYNEK